jgi:DNA-binding NtrC family response regulator
VETRVVLAVDDDPTQLELLGVICSELEYPKIELLTAETGEEGLNVLRSRAVDAVLTDYRLPDMTGLEVVQAIGRLNPLIAVVVITAYESTQEAVESLKAGADDYLVKPTTHDQIAHVLLRITERQNLDRETAELREEIAEDFDTGFITFKSREMAHALNLAARSAKSAASVLLRGESGTGKELVARIIHSSSERSDAPFVAVNVAALPETLVESELFGHVRGSFTGATADRIGRFEDANGGTLFIDEIGDISAAIQVKLLRAIQFGEVQRVGANRPMSLDVRIITATNRNLEEMITNNTFREDLYYRLNVVEIRLPSLNERREDVLPLADHFLAKYRRETNKNVKGFERDAVRALANRRWRGEVRELENVVERAIIFCEGDMIRLEDLPESFRSDAADDDAPPAATLEEAIRRVERDHILRALEDAEGDKDVAAKTLGLGLSTLYRKIKELGVDA